MTNLIDITDVTDRVLDIYLSAKADPETPILTDDLTRVERYQLADLMGWDCTRGATLVWLRGSSEDEDRYQGRDYEGAILARQEADESRWS